MNITSTFHPERAESIMEKIRKSDTPVKHLSYRMNMPQVKSGNDVDDDLSDINIENPSREDIATTSAEFSSKADSLYNMYKECTHVQRLQICTNIVHNVCEKMGYTQADIGRILSVSPNAVYCWAACRYAINDVHFKEYIELLIKDGIPYRILSQTIYAIYNDSAGRMRKARAEKRMMQQNSREGGASDADEISYTMADTKLKKMFGKLSSQHKEKVIQFMFDKLSQDKELQKIVEDYFWEDLI